MLDRIPIPKVDGPVRFGVIGLGMISEFHLKAINRIEQAILLGVASRREEQTKNIAAEHGCYAATDYRELLRIKELDVVCVTTSSGSHYEIGMEVLRSGKHLVVEKPLAMTAEQANELIATAAERRLMLSVISQRRFEPQHGIIKDVLSQGKLGRLLMAEVSCPYYRSQDYYDSADWRGRMDQDGGALMNQGIHSIDLLLWMIASPIVKAYGKVATQTHRMEAEDMALATIQSESGVLGRIFASTSIQPGFPPKLALYGEQGTIVVEGSDITVWCVPGTDRPPSTSSGTGGGVSDPGHISWEPHLHQLTDIVESLRLGRAPLVTGEDGSRAVALIECIYRSSAAGHEVDVTRIEIITE